VFRRLRAAAAAMRMQVAVRSAQPEDVEAAIQGLVQARDGARPGSAAYLIAVRSLANAQHALAVLTSHRKDMEATERAVAEALATTPPGHTFRRNMLMIGAANAAIKAMMFVDADAANRRDRDGNRGARGPAAVAEAARSCPPGRLGVHVPVRGHPRDGRSPGGDTRPARASAASSNLCAVHKFTKCLVLGVAVPPGDVAADHPCLGGVIVVVGAIQREVAQRGELGLDPVEP
jgi:hypothetical protein